jgi:hypothetical protein
MVGSAARLLLRVARPPRVAPSKAVCVAVVARRVCGARARLAPPRAAAMQAAGARVAAAAPAERASEDAAAAAECADDDPVGPPLFSFGVLTDVQYADIPDGQSFGGTPRFYRHSLEGLRCAARRARDAHPLRRATRASQQTPRGAAAASREAVADWRTRDLSFALHLGDILDGFCPKARARAGGLLGGREARARTRERDRPAHTRAPRPPLCAGRERGGAAERAGRV